MPALSACLAYDIFCLPVMLRVGQHRLVWCWLQTNDATNPMPRLLVCCWLPTIDPTSPIRLLL